MRRITNFNKAFRMSSISNKVLFSFFVVSLSIGLLVVFSLYLFLKKYFDDYQAEIDVNNILDSFLQAGSAVVILITLLALVTSIFLTKSVIKPITELKKIANEIKKGNLDYEFNIDGGDEISELTKVFGDIIEDIKKYRQISDKYSIELESMVAQKTNQLQETLNKMDIDKHELEKQRSAILNILEDVQESQESLEESKRDLESRHFQLETLKSLSDELTSVFEVSEAAKLAYKHLKEITGADVITLLISNPFEEGDMYFKSFLKTRVSEKYLNSIKEEIIEYVRLDGGKFPGKKDKILENICPGLEGEDLDNQIASKPVKALMVPLVTGDSFYGLIHLSYSKSDSQYSDFEDSLSRAIGATLSVTIDRLQILDRSQHSKTESLIKSLSDGVIMFTNDKNIVLTNSRATVYTGLFYTSATLDDFIKLFSGIKINEMIEGAIEKGVISHINEVLLINKFYEISVTPVKDNEGEIVGGSIIIHDITYMKEIDRMKTEFVSVASHQLRTPLTAIKLFTEVLVKGDLGQINNEQKEYLENIYQSTVRMVALVNDLLNVTRIESGKLRISPQDTDIIEFIKNLIIEAEPSANSGKINIIFNKSKLPRVKLDQNLFRQVIQNLISNAIRYSRIKGNVEIDVLKDDYYYTIKVKDDGIGIPKDKHDRVFEKFYRADNAIKAVTAGTGLGLYTSKMIVEISGGKIWFESEENKGTTFFVKMPLKGMEEREGERGMMIS